MFRTICIVLALQAFSTLSTPITQERGLITIDPLDMVMKFAKNTDWNNGTLYDSKKKTLFTTKPGKSANTIDVMAPSAGLQTTVNLTPVSGVCDPVTYEIPDEFTFRFQKDSWKLTNHIKIGWVNFSFRPVTRYSFLGQMRLEESPYRIIADISDQNTEYMIKYSYLFSPYEAYITAFLILVDSHKRKCDHR